MAFQQGLSGLNATAKNLSVIGNNIANANTYGSKASRAEFSNLYANAINGTGTSAVGIGVQMTGVAQQFSQGNISVTENTLDLAINGNGFFQFEDSGAKIYSRNGQLQLDKDGYMVNAGGNRLLGYASNAEGLIIPSTIQSLRLPTAEVPPSASTRVSLEFNLDARLASITPPAAPAAPIDFQDPKTYHNATSISVFDGKGQEVALTFYFQKGADDTWDVYATANGEFVPDPTASVPVPVVDDLKFDASNGTLDPASTVLSNLDIPSVQLAAGGFSVAILGLELDLSAATQYGSAFSVTNLSQDGYATGQLTGINIEQDGTIVAHYSNGREKAAGQVVLATFANPQGLQPVGGNGWIATYASGDPVIGAPGQGNIGLIQSGALEESNVDLTAELVNMIVAQRSYQANAQTIKTEDQLLQTIVNLR